MKRLLNLLSESSGKQWLLHAVVFALVLAVGGLLVAVSGIIPIKASSGHWAITEWFLQFSKRRSVDTYSKTIHAPPLDNPAWVLKGAAHYEIGCFPCHGSPQLMHPRVALAMLPPPPYLPERVTEWEPEELFFIIKHGLKFTGMPAWPAQTRDDEVWAMVAFLLEFPSLNAEEYRRLATGGLEDRDAAPLQDLTEPNSRPLRVQQTCGRCHGVDGQGRGRGAFPKLAGQSRDYLAAALKAYAQNERHSGIMQPVAAGLSAEEMRQLAYYYGELDSSNTKSTDRKAEKGEDAEAIQRGRIIAREGVPQALVPACRDCHGPKDSPRNSHYPRLAGQPADYLRLQLELFQKRQRGGSAYADLMHHVADHLRENHIRDVTAYYESLSPKKTD